jgi:hypothetical protein
MSVSVSGVGVGAGAGADTGSSSCAFISSSTYQKSSIAAEELKDDIPP